MRHSKKRSSTDSCHVSGCENEVKRSLSRKKVDSGSDLKLDGEGKRVGLCKKCYSKYKKATKEDRKLETLGR